MGIRGPIAPERRNLPPISLLEKATLAMAVPKRRVSPARQGMRRSHQHVKRKQNTYCDKCSNPILPHHVCWNCGYLNTQGREAAPVKEEKES
jgi:large subunit ribosomal protein L32